MVELPMAFALHEGMSKKAMPKDSGAVTDVELTVENATNVKCDDLPP